MKLIELSKRDLNLKDKLRSKLRESSMKKESKLRRSKENLDSKNIDLSRNVSGKKEKLKS